MRSVVKKLKIAVSLLFFVALAGVMGFGYVTQQRTPSVAGEGVIVSMWNEDGTTYVQRTSRGRTTDIEIQPRVVFRIDIDGGPSAAPSTLPIEAADRYEIGDRVSFEWHTAGVEGIWTKVFVTNISDLG